MTQLNFPVIRFNGELRPSQAEVVDIARRHLRTGNRRLHIVAPPGSGKTVLGLYLWAEHVRQPALVLSPNSAIQAQWAARTDLFHIQDADASGVVSTDSNKPGLLTSLTYQAVTLPRRGGEDLDTEAIQLWQESLIEDGQAENETEASIWIDDLARHNPDYHDRRLANYRKVVRDRIAIGGEALQTLHQSSLDTIHRLNDRGVGLIILDECHHLLGHWGRVLADAHDLFDEPVVIGLTATPPDRAGKNEADVKRYDTFFGPIDFEVPVPAVVKDGFLAPYQDLAYFVRPTAEELQFVAGADNQIHDIVDKLCQDEEAPAEPPTQPKMQRRPDDLTSVAEPEVQAASEEVQVASETTPSHEAFDDEEPLPPDEETADEETSDEATSDEAISSPADGDPPTEEVTKDASLNLPQWLRHVLATRRLPIGEMKDWKSFERRDPVFADAARMFLLSRQIDLPEDVPPPESDLSAAEMPEMDVLVPILDRYVRHYLRRSPAAANHELAKHVTNRLRTLGVQITDTGSQACASPVGRVLAYSHSKAQALVPILTAEHQALGDSIRAVVVCDYEKTSAITAEVEHLLDAESGGAVAAFRMLLSDEATDALDPILITGSTVLVDDDLAEQFETAASAWLHDNGFDVDLSFGQEEGFHTATGTGSDWCPRVYVEMITDLFQQGLTKCLVGTRGLLGEGWDANKINVLVDMTTVTTSMTVNQLRGRSIRLDTEEPRKLANNWDVVCIAPEFSKGLDDYRRFIAKHKHLYGVTDDGAIEKGVGHVHAALTEIRPEGLEGSTSVLNDDMLQRVTARARFRDLWRIGEPYHDEPIRALEARPLAGGEAGFPPFGRSRNPWTSGSLAEAIGRAVLGALCKTGELSQRHAIHVGERAGGYVRVFLKEASEEENRIFTSALHEALGPLHRPRYIIPREIDVVDGTWLSKILPTVVGRYFQRRTRRRVMLHAVPSVLAKNKERVTVYEQFWNRFVSPGEAVYAHRGAGEKMLEKARRSGQTPSSEIHEKDIFI